MTDKIVPLTKKDEYVLEDKDYLLIMAIRDLTSAINLMRLKHG